MKRPPRDALALCVSYPATLDPRQVQAIFDRPGVAAAYLFGSLAQESSHPLSDIDLAYLGKDRETEERLYDPLYEALQRLLGEGNFDLLPLRRASLHLQFHVAMEGSLLLVRAPITVEDFAVRALMHYWDFKPYRDAYFAAGR